MTDQLNTDAFGEAMEVLGVELNRLANRGQKLFDIELKKLINKWQEVLKSPVELQASLITQALRYFDMAMQEMNKELGSSNIALKSVFDILPEINGNEED